MNERAVTATYTAEGDVFAWRIAAEVVRRVARSSPPLAAHLSERVLQLLALAGKEHARQASAAALAEQSMERPLGDLMRSKVLCVSPDTRPLLEGDPLYPAQELPLGHPSTLFCFLEPLKILIKTFECSEV